MFKIVKDLVWAFDAEWIPDPQAGRRLYSLSEELSDADVMAHMWKEGGGTEEEPTPYLKTIMCRLVSIAAVQRYRHKNGQVTLKLLSLPKIQDPESQKESVLISTFLNALGERQPQLVGFNSLAADLRILVQRSVVLGLSFPRFAKRPNKPWEGIDYFARGGDAHIDLKDHATPGWGSGSPSLHELAVLSGIPGKMDTDGQQVPTLWLADSLDKIIAYNETDALTTYLVWLRMAHFAGHFSADQYKVEQDYVVKLIEQESVEKPHLTQFLTVWQQLSGAS